MLKVSTMRMFTNHTTTGFYDLSSDDLYEFCVKRYPTFQPEYLKTYGDIFLEPHLAAFLKSLQLLIKGLCSGTSLYIPVFSLMVAYTTIQRELLLKGLKNYFAQSVN